MTMAFTYALAGSAVLGGIALLLLGVRLQLVLASISAALCATMFAAAILTDGLYLDAYYGLDDVIMFMDAAARTAAGLVPSVDYPSPIGPLYFAIIDQALALAPFSLRTLVLSNTLVAAGALGLTLVLLAGRVSLLTLSAMALLVVATALSMREITYAFALSATSAISPYNRWGWALFAPVALRFFIPPPARPGWLTDLTAALAGAVIVVLFFIKASYGAVGLALVIGSAIVRPKGGRDALWALAGLAAATAVCLATVDGIGAHLGDLAAAASVSTGLSRFYKTMRILGEAGAYLTLALVLLALLQPPRQDETYGAWALRLWRPSLLIAGMVFGGILALFQNHYASEALSYVIALMVAWEWARHLSGASVGTATATAFGLRPHTSNILQIMVFAVMTHWAVIDAGSVAGQFAATKALTPVPWLQDTRMARLFLYPKRQAAPGEPCPDQLCQETRKVSEGLAALEGRAGPDDTVLGLRFSNPFSALIGTPPRGAPIWFHEGRSFSRTLFPDPDRVFAGVDWVMIDKAEANVPGLLAVYGELLERDFVDVAETPTWRILSRRPAAGSAPD